MNRLKMYRLLRRNVKLSEKRNPALDESKVAKVMMYIGAVVMAIYMIFIGSIFGKLAAEEDEPGILLLMMPFLLIIDFLLRFVTQQTPMVFVKPYLLMPMPAMTVVESYLLSLVTSGYNMLWLTLLLPYAFINLVAGVSFQVVLALVICGLLMVMANSQWYLLVRTLVARSLLWWALPVAVYALPLLPLFLDDSSFISLDTLADFFYEAPAFWLLALVVLALLLALLFVNRQVQLRFIRKELSKEQKKSVAMKRVIQFTFLERFGLAGEYLKLELKSIMRNKSILGRVKMSLVLVVMLSGLISFSDVYDNRYLLNFWCYYCFAIYGMTALVKIMSPEGNYIDLLMTQRENILLLLKAKYYFHVAILLVPLLIMLPAVINGKFTVMMMLAYMLLTSGLCYFIIFQLAVYNKQTLPLNSQVMGKNGVESGFQLLIEMVGMIAPLVLVGVMLLFFEEDTAYAVMALLGLVLTVAHPIWLRNIYRRLMKRKYVNMEGFHASR